MTRKEPKRNRTEVLPLTSLNAYRLAPDLPTPGLLFRRPHAKTTAVFSPGVWERAVRKAADAEQLYNLDTELRAGPEGRARYSYVTNTFIGRSEELCDSGGGRPGLPDP